MFKATVHPSTLTDGSMVYDVHLDQSGDNQTVVINCDSSEIAHTLELLISTRCAGFAIHGEN